MNETIEKLIRYISEELGRRNIKNELKRMIAERTSTAGVRPEEVFTREFLCPSIARFFYTVIRSEIRLTDSEIESGLGTEGFQNCPGFGFTPASSRMQLFTKSDIIKSAPPESWFQDSKKNVSAFQACPDFAIAHPLPISVVGEVKFFSKGSDKVAVRELYDAARQAMFYLGVFQDVYDAALLVVADASPNHTFFEGLETVNPELLERFGPESNVYLAPVKLR